MKEMSGFSDKRDMLKKILELIKSYNDTIERDYYLKEVSDKLDIKLDLVYQEYNKTKIQKSREETYVYKSPVGNLSSEDLMIGLILKYPERFENIKQSLLYRDFLGNDLKVFLEK